MSYEIKGKIINIGETQQFPSGFQKRELVIETHHDKYPQKLKFEGVKAFCDRLDSVSVGQNVILQFEPRGNEYNGKFYVSLQAWKIDAYGPQQRPPQGAAGSRDGRQNGARPPAQVADEYDDDDQIPF